MPTTNPSFDDFLALSQRVTQLETALNLYTVSPLAVNEVTTEQACQILRCSRPTLRKLLGAGRITATYVGTRPRYNLASLRAYLSSRHVTEEAIAALVAQNVR